MARDVVTGKAPRKRRKQPASGARSARAAASARAHATAALNAGAADFHLWFDNNPLPMWVYDRDDFTFLAVNDAALRRYGYTRAQFLALTIFDIRPPEEVPRLKQALAATPDGLYVGKVWKHRAKSGELFDVEITAHSISFDGHRAEFVLAVDVTERLRAENALRASEAKLARAQEVARLGSWEWDIASQRVSWSNETYRLFGVAPGADVDIAALIDERVHPDDRARLREVMEACARDGSPRPLELRLRLPDGRVRIVWAEGESQFDAAGRPVRMFGTMLDITERKHAEDALAQHNRLLSTLAAVNQMLMHEADEQRLFDQTCRIVVNHAEWRMAWIGLTDADGTRVRAVAVAGCDEGYARDAEVRCDDSAQGRGATGTAIRENRTVVVDDFDTEAQAAPWRARARAHGFRASAALPLRVQGAPIGSLNVYAAQPRAFGAQELTLLERIAGDIGFAVERLRKDAERRRTEELLRQSEERLRTAFEADSATMIILRLSDHVVLYVNRAWEEATGWPRAAVLGRPITELDLWADRVGRAALIERARCEGSVRNVEWQRRTRGGEMRDVLGSIERIEVEGSECVVIFTHDITERKRVEQALRHSEERFRQVFQSSPVVLSITRERDSVFVDLNDAFCEVTGWTRPEAIGHTDLELGLWPSLDERQAMLARLLAEGAIHGAEWQTRTRDGALRHVLGSVERMQLNDEPCILVVGQDITERKRAEAERRKLSSAVEQTADSVIITDRRGVIEYVNPAYEHTTGYSRAEMVGQTPSIIKSGRHDEQFYQTLWRTILAGEVYRNVMVNRRKDGSLYYEEKTITPLKNERGEITHFISTGKDITERMQAQEHLQYLAHHDDLTRLPNRVLFMDRLDQALIRAHFHHRILAVLFLDLDHFKNINDTLGHNVGDRFLETTAQRLADCVREGDTVARLGGDEFAVLLEDIAQLEDISLVARKVLAAFDAAFTVEGHELFITTSIGVSLYPNDGADGHTLLKHADAAMYKAKELGRNNFQYYSADMSARAFERLTLETHLRHALEREEFVLYYQPQVDVTQDRIVGVEALIRWRHPEFGLLAPQQFITLAEDTGLIVPIGEWVARGACEQAREWRALGLGDIRVAVNLSARQFNEPDFVDRMVRLVADSLMEAGMLELELTEGTVMKNAPQTVEKLHALSNLGVRFAIDDFGTGYSSLSYLSRFPIHTLKIDRQFVQNAPRDANDTEIVKTIIAMARSLKLAVVAEGVEEASQRAFLRDQGCDVMQGYLFCHPLPVEELTELLRSGKTLG